MLPRRCIYIYICIIHSFIHPSIHPYIHTSIHPCILASVHPCMYACMLAYIHTHTYISMESHQTINPASRPRIFKKTSKSWKGMLFQRVGTSQITMYFAPLVYRTHILEWLPAHINPFFEGFIPLCHYVWIPITGWINIPIHARSGWFPSKITSIQAFEHIKPYISLHHDQKMLQTFKGIYT